jgi:hypothetical protein
MNENLKDILIVGLPTLMVLVGILLNRNDSNQLRGEMATLRGEMRAEFSNIRSEFNQMRDLFHSDIVHLLEHDRDQDSRITRIEERTK